MNIKKPRKNLEGRIQLSILKILKYDRSIVIGKTKTMGTFDPGRRVRRTDPWAFTGFPDLTGFIRINKKKAALFFIEVKSPTGKLSENQIEFAELCKMAKIKHFVARDLNQFFNEFKFWKHELFIRGGMTTIKLRREK